MHSTNTFQWSLQIEESHLDANGHANNVVYVQWMQDVAVQHSIHVGCTPELYQQLNATWVARVHHVQYLQPAVLNDQIELTTWIASRRKVSCVRAYEFHRERDGKLLTKAETEWVFVDEISQRPRAIHAEVLQRFQLDPPVD